MKNVTLVTEDQELDNRVPWNEKWYGTFESEGSYEEGQEIDFNFGGLTGEAPRYPCLQAWGYKACPFC